MVLFLAACLIESDYYAQRRAELLDQDGDGHVSAEWPEEGGDDCDDTDPMVHPGADEAPYDGVDNDCDPETLDDDLDLDGYGVADDCDDDAAGVHPGANEICDGVDNDCDGFDSCLPAGAVELAEAPLSLVLTDEVDTATGAAIAPVDFDGDGLADIVIGSPLALDQAGRVDIVTGLDALDAGAHDLDKVASLTIDGAQGEGLLGTRILAGCDVDGDGFEDAVLANSTGSIGQVFAFDGGPLRAAGRVGLDAAALVVQSTEPDLAFGSGAACAGLDDSLATELVVGEPRMATTGDGRGRVWVFTAGQAEAGATLTTADAAASIEMGSAPGGGLGDAVGPMGDLDGDGRAEVAVSSESCEADQNCLWIASGGELDLSSGATTTITTDELAGVIIGPDDRALGTTITPAGDVDGDGHADLLLAWRDDNVGAYGAWLFVGLGARADWTLREGDVQAQWDLSYTGEQLGNECAGASDVDGDGLDDVVIGEPAADIAATYGGAALLFLGGTDLQGALGRDDAWATLYAEVAGRRAGTSVALGWDATGDGFGDLFVGAPDIGAPGGAVAAWWGGPRPAP